MGFHRIDAASAVILQSLISLGSCSGGNASARKKSQRLPRRRQPVRLAGVLESSDLPARQTRWSGEDGHASKGVCTHRELTGACGKIFLMGSRHYPVIRVESSGRSGEFRPQCVNSVVLVTGRLDSSAWTKPT